MSTMVKTPALSFALAFFCVAAGAETGSAPPAYTTETTSLGPYSDNMPSARFSDDGRHCLRAIRGPGAAGAGKSHAIYLDEKRVGEYADVKELSLGAEGAHWAALLASGKQTIVVADGQASGPYDEVRVSLLPAGVVYFARTDKKWTVGAGGKTLGEYDQVGRAALGANGRCAFWAKTDKLAQFIVDGRPYAEGRIDWSALSDDGSRVACQLRDSGKDTVILDGRRLGPYDGMWHDNIQFTPDSAHLVFPAKQDGKWMVVIDGQASAAHDAVGYVTFGGEGKHIAYCARSGEQWSVVVDGKAVSTFVASADSRASELALSPDGKRTAYYVQAGGKVAAVVDGKKGPDFDLIISWDGYGTFFFSPDSRHVAYLGCRGARKETANIIVHDGQEDRPCDATGIPILLNDGRCCYWAQKGKEHFLVVGGKEEGPFDFVPDITGDGTRLAYTAAVKGKQSVVMDSKKGPEFQSVSSVAFSPDGRHWAYLASDGKRQITVLDGRLLDETFDAGRIPWPRRGIRFDSDGSLEYLAVRGETLYRVRHILAK